jgi:hypothetical protein
MGSRRHNPATAHPPRRRYLRDLPLPLPLLPLPLLPLITACCSVWRDCITSTKEGRLCGSCAQQRSASSWYPISW